MREVEKDTCNIKPTETIDVAEFNCPLPLLKIKKKLAKLSLGDILQVSGIHTNLILEIKRWCERNGHFFLGEKEVHFYKYIYIEKG